ncbi:hypothetical protein MSG28_011448 [Choristoneura fumiferana]|uniref:Uncharacterized protein n=1 Tax=Choristoneura fumiferana TaxID=7141 RepID=A0ACC0JNG2_CHOFU|nr:hypothetical protein MSG28_011448 [Choristoneura fumiferana]
MSCAACFKPVDNDELLLCKKCNCRYHYSCLRIPFEYFKKILQDVKNEWRCTSCTNVTRRYKGDGTPVRTHYEHSPPVPTPADMSICDESQQDYSTIDHSILNPNQTCNTTTTAEFSMEGLASLLDSKLADVKRDLVMIDTKLGATKQEIFAEMKNEFAHVIDRIKTEFSETTDFLSDQIKGFKTDLSIVNRKIRDLEQENSRLNAELQHLKSNPSTKNSGASQEVIEKMHLELNERDQALLLNDVEISGVPEHQGESALHITQTLSQKLGISLEERDIVSAERAGPRKTYSGEDRSGTRPRPLVVRLARRALRDQILRSARVRRTLDTSYVGLPEHSPYPIYVNERLTKTNRNIFWKSRRAGSAAGWKFVWTKEGRIYARRTDSNDSRAVRIQSEKDILRVFGVDPTASSDN